MNDQIEQAARKIEDAVGCYGDWPRIAAIISRHLSNQWVKVTPETMPPKDGSEVLLRVKRGGMTGSVVAHYMPGGYCIEDHPAIDEGWYFWNKTYFDIAPNPTHYMPLPAPPSASTQGENK